MAFTFDDDGPSIKKRVNKSEQTFAKKHGGKCQPCSGALGGLRGDVKFDDLLVDLKSTINSSFRVTLADLQKITKEADGLGKEPALILQFIGCKNFTNEWAVVPLSVLKGE